MLDLGKARPSLMQELDGHSDLPAAMRTKDVEARVVQVELRLLACDQVTSEPWAVVSRIEKVD